jgi:co-chaperonin GroES (HSP10)|tara:strand:- start:10 stop:447 length:438 start_codon:yes stop_codon:yes gene_type:complete
MTSKSNIIKPDYIKDEVNSPSEKEVPKPTQDYIKHMDRLPDPVGYRILLKMWKMAETTKGGIALSEQTLETSEMTSVVGYVVKMGNMCYTDTEKFLTPWCKEGQFVVIGRYAGARFKTSFGEHRIINDDEIIGTIEKPEDILALF